MSEWYYGRGGEQNGPVDEVSLRSRIKAGEVISTDLVWKEGMAKWLPLAQVSELSLEASSVQVSPYAAPATKPVASGAVPYRAAPTSGLAIASLVCGVLAIMLSCNLIGIVTGIPAIICGHMANNRMKAPGNIQSGKGMALAGLICGYIASLISVIVVGLFGFIFFAASQVESNIDHELDDAGSDFQAPEAVTPTREQ